MTAPDVSAPPGRAVPEAAATRLSALFASDRTVEVRWSSQPWQRDPEAGSCVCMRRKAGKEVHVGSALRLTPAANSVVWRSWRRCSTATVKNTAQRRVFSVHCRPGSGAGRNTSTRGGDGDGSCAGVCAQQLHPHPAPLRQFASSVFSRLPCARARVLSPWEKPGVTRPGAGVPVSHPARELASLWPWSRRLGGAGSQGTLPCWATHPAPI